MKIQIPYGGATVNLTLPDGAVILKPKQVPVADEKFIKEKFISCISQYEDSFRNKKVSIVVNDATRRLPTSAMLHFISEVLPADKCEILIATGTHRPPSDHEIDIILGGARRLFSGRIHSHNCRDEGSLVNIGCTSRGTPVVVNRRLLDAECIICINSVEPHFFAGFTGGRKSLIPGLAGFETTVANHSLAKYEEARSLNLDDNPVHLDLEEAISLIPKKEIFSIQLVISRSGGIIDLQCGELEKSFEVACKKAREYYTIGTQSKFDIVIAVGEEPLDMDLYQLQKGQEHGAEAVRDGGILIVAGACNEGAGSEYFVKLADDYPDPGSALTSKAMADKRFGIHKLVKTARRLQQMKIWYVTNLDDKVVSKVYYEPKSSLQAAMDDALSLMGSYATIAVLKDACYFVPMMVVSKGGK